MLCMCLVSVRAADLDSLALDAVCSSFWTYAGWSSGIFQWWCRKLQEETVGTGCLCPAAPLLSGTSTTPSLPRGKSAERTEGTWNPETLGKLQELTLWWIKEMKANNGKVKSCSHTTLVFMCMHLYTHTSTALGQSCQTLTLLFISSLPSSKVAEQQNPLSQAWQSAIFNPLKMIIEFALIPFQCCLPSSAPITTPVTSDPAPVPHAHASYSLHKGLGV